jgi:RNA polymerase sigma factor (sigma-70 family)
MSRAPDDDFDRFVADCEPRLRRALVAAYGPEMGREAALVALSWAWQHWDRVLPMENSVGYLFRVGQTSARRALRRRQRDSATLDDGVAGDGRSAFDPDLGPALAGLSMQQRTAVVLVHGYGIPLREVAETMEVSVATVREHTARALVRLRNTMEVSDVR